MAYRLIYPESYVRKVPKFLSRHPEVLGQYQKTLALLEVNPQHPSLRLHPLQGRLTSLHSVSINRSYRIVLTLFLQGSEIIIVDIGNHDHVY